MKSEHLNLTKAVDQLTQRGLSGLIILRNRLFLQQRIN